MAQHGPVKAEANDPLQMADAVIADLTSDLVAPVQRLLTNAGIVKGRSWGVGELCVYPACPMEDRGTQVRLSARRQPLKVAAVQEG